MKTLKNSDSVIGLKTKLPLTAAFVFSQKKRHIWGASVVSCEIQHAFPILKRGTHVDVSDEMRNGIAFRERPYQIYLFIYAWRLPSLVCEHTSYAAWCFWITCFYDISLLRAWLTMALEVSVALFFFSLLTFISYEKKRHSCPHILEVGNVDGRHGHWNFL